MKELIRLEDISKSFSGVQALSDVNINLYEGEVHVLLGENGAGKSTLMKVLTGIYQPDSGSIYYEGKQVHLQNPKQAEQLASTLSTRNSTCCCTRPWPPTSSWATSP